jgi:hypothetical protein
MVGSLKKVKPGDPLVIPASTFNTFVDVAGDFLRRQHQQGQTGTPAGRQSGIVLVKNTSGADRNRFDILGVDGVVIAPADNLDGFKNQVALVGVTPASSHAGRFVILQEPIVAGEVGLAVAAGVCPVKVNVAAESDTLAEAVTGDAGKLASGATGSAIILWKETGTGVKWAVVRLGSPAGGAAAIPVKLTASAGGGSYTGKEQVWSGSAWSDKPGAATITCINLSETTGGCTSGLDVSPAPVVLATAISGTYFFERETNAKYKA